MSWFYLAPLDFLVSLLAYPMAIIIVLCTNEQGISPYWAWPFLTVDNPIDGDAGHLARWPDNGTKWRVFCRRVAWLWRNKSYGFSTLYLGRKVSGPTKFKGNRNLSSNPLNPGWCWATNSGAWELYAFIPYTPWFGLRVRLGWSIPLTIDEPDEISMLKTHINPFMPYTR